MEKIKTCETPDCDEVVYENDRFCTPCALTNYYSSKPVGHDFGD